MKAVVLAARPNPPRLHPFTDTRPKSMIPVAGTRILKLTLQSLREAGIYEIIVVNKKDLSSSLLSSHSIHFKFRRK